MKKVFSSAGRRWLKTLALGLLWSIAIPQVVFSASETLPAGTTPPPGVSGWPSAPYRSEEVKITNAADRVELAGTLTVPGGAGPFPAVVLLSGQDAQTRDAVYNGFALFGSLADDLARHGIAVLRLDDRGVGRSTGDSTATTAAKVHDAQAAVAYLRTLPSIDVAHVGLLGHGEGGNVALLAAAQPLPPNFVVALAAAGLPGREVLVRQRPSLLVRAGCPDTMLQHQARRSEAFRRGTAQQVDRMRALGNSTAEIDIYVEKVRQQQKASEKMLQEAQLARRKAMLDIIANTPDDGQAQAILINMIRQDMPLLSANAVRAGAARLTSPWYRYYITFDPQRELAKVRGSVLLLHGTADEWVDAETNLAALAKGLKGNARATVQKYEGLNHLFQAPPAEGAEAKTAAVLSPAVLTTLREWIHAHSRE